MMECDRVVLFSLFFVVVCLLIIVGSEPCRIPRLISMVFLFVEREGV